MATVENLDETPTAEDKPSNPRDRSLAIALIDQGIVSAGTFLTNIAVARLTLPATYGTYALYLSAMQLLNNVHGAVVIYPLSMALAGTKATDPKRSPLQAALILTVILGAIAGCAILPLISIWDKKNLSLMALPALIAWQIQESLRRALMAQLKFAEAAVGDFISYPFQALLVFACSSRYEASLHLLFFCFFITSILASLFQWCFLTGSSHGNLGVKETAVSFWLRGRWNLVGAILNISSVQGVPAVLGARFGTVSVAQFFSLFNVLGVTHPVMFGISNAAIPKIAHAKARAGSHAGRHEGLKIALWGAALLGSYILFVAFFPSTTLATFYGAKSAYMKLVGPLELTCANYAFIYISTASVMILNGLDLSKRALPGNYAFAICSIALNLPLAAFYGLKGAILGMVLTGAIKATFQALAVRNSVGKIESSESKFTNTPSKITEVISAQ